jgi:hypothetical protein
MRSRLLRRRDGSTSGRQSPATKPRRRDFFSWELQLGHLDPPEKIAGVQARLANLDYYNGPVDDTESLDLHLAVAAFELKVGLDVTGDPSSIEMQKKLHGLHDGP